MTKLRTLALLCALLLLVPVLGADAGVVDENNDLLVELACDPNQSRAPAEIDIEATDPVFMTGCTAEKTDCFNGPDISCTGTSTCEVSCGWVTCDGVSTDCHSCNAGCNTPEYCACRSCGGSNFNCLTSWCT